MARQAPQDATLLLEGVRFDVYAVQLPGSQCRSVRRDVVAAPDAVVILPILDDENIVMIRNERFAVGQRLWELPAGTIESGEAPETCAARELIEEAGYKAKQVTPLTVFFPSPGICTERMHAYRATGLTHVGQSLDENERITPEVVAFDQALTMVRDGTIKDAKTIATLLYHHTFTRTTT